MVNLVKKSIPFIMIVILIVVIIFAVFLNAKQTQESAAPTFIKEESIQHVLDIQIENAKMQDFIVSHLPNKDVYLDSGVSWEGGSAKELPLQALYASIIERDTSLLMSAFTGESFQELSETNYSYEEKIERLSESINLLSRGGKLQQLSFSFKKDRYGGVENEGTLYLKYTDGITYDVQFEVEAIKDGGHDHEEGYSYQIQTPLQTILNHLSM